MIFHCLEYIVFLLLVLAVYWNLSRTAQNLFLIGASYYFYGCIHPWFLLPFLATTLIDYSLARAIEAQPERGRLYLTLSIVSNLTLLGVFKYYNFFAENAAALLTAIHLPASLPVLQVVLPAGISFYTFQSIGYVTDVWRRQIPACRNLREFAVFVSFFPQLVAGPIMRARQMLEQVRQPRTLDPARMQSALFLLLWGFFKKLVIADNVAVIANKVFALSDPDFPLLWVGVLAFTVQIYADFSAYTDIARGSARLLGFELVRNFNDPYLASSPADFWRRWHMSLSSWIRDYVYIPLGGSRVSPTRAAGNILLVFFLTGLWHGASWNYVLWGVWNGMLILIYRLAARVIPVPAQSWPGAHSTRVGGMFALTLIGWLIFREKNIHQLWHDLTLSPWSATVIDWQVAAYLGMVVMLYALPLLLHTFLRNVKVPQSWREGFGHWQFAGQALLGALLFTGILILRSTVSADFIYFQF